jgi:hypothetical protein
MHRGCSVFHASMNLTDYLTQQDGIDWSTLLDEWKWLLPDTFELWLVSKFADLVIVRADGSVWFVDTSAGSIQQIAESRDQFGEVIEKDVDSFCNWFMTFAVDELVAAGLTLNSGQCYSYKHPPGLGGPYEMANFVVTDLAVHLGLHGQIFGQTKSLPDGAKVILKIE